MLFAVALATWPIANLLRENEALVRRQEVDLANLAQLSQYIVQHLRESILVLDAQDRIRLINESAAQILGDDRAYPEALVGEASPRLLYLLESWRRVEQRRARSACARIDLRCSRRCAPHQAALRAARRGRPGPGAHLPGGHHAV